MKDSSVGAVTPDREGAWLEGLNALIGGVEGQITGRT
jgi:hypothetical protein